MNRLFQNLAITTIICALLLSLVPVAAATEPSEPMEYENISIGGGGSYYLPIVDPSNPDHYVAASDMSGLYYSFDGGESWQRNNTSRVYAACVAEDGTVFAGGYGLQVSNDGGKTLELIYPREEDVFYSINRLGRVDGIMMADGYDNGFVVALDTYEDWVYFITIDWSDAKVMRLCRSKFDGTELELLYTVPKGVSPLSVEYLMEVEENRIVYSDGEQVWQFDLQSREMTVLYTAQGEIVDFDRIGENYFLLVENTARTDILYTTDFASWKDLSDFNTLPNTFLRGGVEYQFSWRFSNLCGNNFENIYLSFYSPVVGTNAVSGVMKFDGEAFQWIYDTAFTWNRGSGTDFGWITYTITAAYGMCADPTDDNHFLVSNIETVFDVTYENGERYVKNLGCVDNGDGTYTSRGLNCQSTYFVREDPFDPDHIAVCTTDLGLQLSYDGGESFRRMQLTWERVCNTCYDLYFDPNTPDLVYGLWSSRHDAPYSPKLSDVSAVGSFSVSRDGGVSWEHFYGEGIPANSIPVKMSVVPDGDQLMIAVATFNNGFYLSRDSGKTFTSISEGMETYYDMIWGSDVVIVDDAIYCLTASNDLDGRMPSILYRYDMTTGELSRVDLGQIVLARSLTYDERFGLFVSVTPYYRSEYNESLKRNVWVNYGGGVYRVTGDSVELEYEVYNGAYHCDFASDGTMYITGELGQVYVRQNGEYRLYADGLFQRLRTISFSADEKTMYVSTLGGGLYRMPTAEPAVSNSVPEQFTVTFRDYDGIVLDQQTVVSGGAVSSAVVPAREPDETYHYTLQGWDTDTGMVTEDLTVTAVYEAGAHETVIRNAVEATCTAEGYTGDEVCADCGLVVTEGTAIAPTGHTPGGAELLSEGVHGIRCVACGEIISQAPCTDEDADGVCDICGAEMQRRFVRAENFEEGKRYLLVSNGSTFAKPLQSIPVELTLENGCYTADIEITEQMLWTYSDGQLHIIYNDMKCYLYVVANNFRVALTSDVRYGNVWTYSDGTLSTRAMNMFWRVNKNLSLSPSVGLTANNTGSSFQLYKLVE